MPDEAQRDVTVLRDARRSSLMTQSDFAKKIGTTVQTVSNKEREPDRMSIRELSKWYSLMGTDGKVWIREYVDSFFT